MRVCPQVLWGLINCIPTAIMGIVAWVYAADGAAETASHADTDTAAVVSAAAAAAAAAETTTQR